MHNFPVDSDDNATRDHSDPSPESPLACRIEQSTISQLNRSIGTGRERGRKEDWRQRGEWEEEEKKGRTKRRERRSQKGRGKREREKRGEASRRRQW